MRKPWDSNPQAARAATCFQDRLLIRPVGFRPTIPDVPTLSRSGGWNRTSGLHVQSVASLPAATAPEFTESRIAKDVAESHESRRLAISWPPSSPFPPDLVTRQLPIRPPGPTKNPVQGTPGLGLREGVTGRVLAASVVERTGTRRKTGGPTRITLLPQTHASHRRLASKVRRRVAHKRDAGAREDVRAGSRFFGFEARTIRGPSVRKPACLPGRRSSCQGYPASSAAAAPAILDRVLALSPALDRTPHGPDNA